MASLFSKTPSPLLAGLKALLKIIGIDAIFNISEAFLLISSITVLTFPTTLPKISTMSLHPSHPWSSFPQLQFSSQVLPVKSMMKMSKQRDFDELFLMLRLLTSICLTFIILYLMHMDVLSRILGKIPTSQTSLCCLMVPPFMATSDQSLARLPRSIVVFLTIVKSALTASLSLVTKTEPTILAHSAEWASIVVVQIATCSEYRTCLLGMSSSLLLVLYMSDLRILALDSTRFT